MAIIKVHPPVYVAVFRGNVVRESFRDTVTYFEIIVLRVLCSHLNRVFYIGLIYYCRSELISLVNKILLFHALPFI